MERLRARGFRVEPTVYAPAFQVGLEHNFGESVDHCRHPVWTGLNVEDEFDHTPSLCYLRATFMGPVERYGYAAGNKCLGGLSGSNPQEVAVLQKAEISALQPGALAPVCPHRRSPMTTSTSGYISPPLAVPSAFVF